MQEIHYKLCKLCQSERVKTVYTSRRTGLPIMQCKTCGLFFVGKVFNSAEQHTVYEDEAGYRAFVEAERSVPEVHMRYLDWLGDIQRQISPIEFANAKQRKPRLLDIGCGAGDFLVVARDHGFEVHGIDISAPAVRLAAKSHGIQVRLGAVEDYPFESLFDVVTMIGVLEHVLDPKFMLMHAHRLLAPGALLFIYTPVWGMYDVLTSLMARISNGRFTRPIDRHINENHLQIFPKSTLVKLLQDLDLEPLTCDVVCEYNLPVYHYLQSLGITNNHAQTVMTKFFKALIDRKLFFRNNMRVTARKL